MRGFSSVLTCPRLERDLGHLPQYWDGSTEGTTETAKHPTARAAGSADAIISTGRPVFGAGRLLLAG
jgi:hypothetical protein